MSQLVEQGALTERRRGPLVADGQTSGAAPAGEPPEKNPTQIALGAAKPADHTDTVEDR